MSKHYEAAIIGSGPGGYVSAIRLRQLEKKVCVIDSSAQRLGGVCLNEGCIPAKALLYSSRLFSAIKEAEKYGVEAEAKKPDMKRIVAASREASLRLRKGLEGLFKKYGIVFMAGEARLLSKNEISVTGADGKEERLIADKIIIASGSRPKALSSLKVDGKIVLTSKEAITLEKLPESLLVAGAGAVGSEMASLFASCGAKVALVEMMPRIVPSEDEEIAKALTRFFKKKGIAVLAGTRIKDLVKKKDSVEAVLEESGRERKVEFERALIAAGRSPNIENIGLQKAGVAVKDGFIATDAKMRTNVEGIYAVGDIVNTPMYAHVAYEEGRVAAEDIAGVKTPPINYENIPNVIFSEPQIASVGLTEWKAREMKKDIAVSRNFFKANGLAVATRREEGFIKVIADRKTREILGVHLIGSEAAEIIHEFVIAKTAGLKADDIARAVHAHPTFSEIAADAARSLFGKPIHG